jgi:hypothetical protein
MESRVTTKILGYIESFKDDLTVQIHNGLSGDALVEYMYNYDKFSLSGEDFQKRKRTKNLVPLCDRCIANRIDHTQCSRRKQADQPFCGTHSKGQPYGIVEINPVNTIVGTHRSHTVWCEDVNGIYYYIDDSGNVYSPEDILANKQNPKIITKYVKIGDTYTIPSFFDT